MREGYLKKKVGQGRNPRPPVPAGGRTKWYKKDFISPAEKEELINLALRGYHRSYIAGKFGVKPGVVTEIMKSYA